MATPQDFVIPAAIGTDINCGMRLLTLGLSAQQAEAQRARIMQALTHVLLQNGRNIPVHSKAFEALLTQNPHAFFAENRFDAGLWHSVDQSRLLHELDHVLVYISSKMHQLNTYLMRIWQNPIRFIVILVWEQGSGNHFCGITTSN